MVWHSVPSGFVPSRVGFRYRVTYADFRKRDIRAGTQRNLCTASSGTRPSDLGRLDVQQMDVHQSSEDDLRDGMLRYGRASPRKTLCYVDDGFDNAAIVFRERRTIVRVCGSHTSSSVLFAAEITSLGLFRCESRLRKWVRYGHPPPLPNRCYIRGRVRLW